MHSAQLKELAGEFSGNRMTVAKSIRQMQESDPSGFVRAAAEILRDSAESPGAKFLLVLLMNHAAYLDILCNPELFTVEQSILLVQQAKTMDPQVEVKLARILSTLGHAAESQAGFPARVLEVLDKAADPATEMPALRQLLHSSNERVRSKAALLIGRIAHNPQWAKLSDLTQDVRVVANAVESLWGLNTPAAKTAFHEATQDPRHRVAANGAVGLYLAGDPEAVPALFRLSRRPQPEFRAAAAWSMGHTGDARFLTALAGLRDDPEPAVGHAAASATEGIQQRLSEGTRAAALPLHIRSAKCHAGEHTVEVLVGEGGSRLRGMNWPQFVIFHGDTLVEELAVEEVAQSQPVLYRLRFSAPPAASRIVKVQLFCDQGQGEDSGFEMDF